MKIRTLATGSLLMLAMSCPATAGVFVDDLNRCSLVAATPEDRATLGRWIFMVAAANPAFADLVAISDAERQRNNRAVASVVERILLRDCRQEALAALRNEGDEAAAHTFDVFGQIAGVEMMGSPANLASANALDQLMDQAGLQALRREAGLTEPPRPATQR